MYEAKSVMTYETPVDLSRHKSDIMVVHCGDPRFQTAYRQWIDSLNKYYDLMAIKGASKSITDNPTVIEDIEVYWNLHHFEQIYIGDHVSCGGFGPVDDELKAHGDSLAAAKARLQAVPALAGVAVKTYLLTAKEVLALD